MRLYSPPVTCLSLSCCHCSSAFLFLLSALVVLAVTAQSACAQARQPAASGPITPVSIPPAPATQPTLDVPLRITRRPATLGIPFKESANVRDPASIALVDETGKAVPAQFRVLSRWRAPATDTGRPIKWLLVDADAPAGNYRLVLGNNQKPSVSVNVASTSSGSYQIEAGRIKLSVPASGSSLLTSLKLDNIEQLARPVTLMIELPRAALLVGPAAAGTTQLRVTDTGPLAAGTRLRFEHTGKLLWDAAAGDNRFAARAGDAMMAGRAYRLDEGTPREEEVFAVREEQGWLYTRAPLRFPHPRGSRVRDLAAEQETVELRALRGQTVITAAPLRQAHGYSEKVVIADASDKPLKLVATITQARLEEQGPLRVVIRQDGHFQPAEAREKADPLTPLRFTLRYHIYAAHPFLRLQLRLINTGPYGFGGDRNGRPPFAQHVLLNWLTVHLPFAAEIVRPQREEARSARDKRIATISVGQASHHIEVTVPEFSENFPKLLAADTEGVRFEILPRGFDEYLFEGARAKSTEFYLGLETRPAAAMTNSLGGALDPAYVAETAAVHPVMVERRNWMKFFTEDREMAVAATRLERWLASAYAREENESSPNRTGQSIFEVRQQGQHYGWQNFGDLEWADGYTNLHYDLPYILLREYTRTADVRAFQLGSEMARYRADWGQHHADDYWDTERTMNFRGLAFYEKGEHGSYREPLVTHTWIEGLWLYWALTGDEAVHESALEGSETLARREFTFYNSLSWNEPRWVGWPVLGLMAAWRYSGKLEYLNQAKIKAYLLVQAEEDYGRKGYFIPSGSGIGQAVQPFMWSGYAQIGVIEYWRETADRRVADYLVRIADWLMGKNGSKPVLMGGQTQRDGNYLPLSTPYFWYPDKASENSSVALAIMSLPLLTVTAQITGREDHRVWAQRLFRDAAYYRDVPENASINRMQLSPISFNSATYSGSAPKIYGQFGLFVPLYLAERAREQKQQR